jgi:hypothetical protein
MAIAMMKAVSLGGKTSLSIPLLSSHMSNPTMPIIAVTRRWLGQKIKTHKEENRPINKEILWIVLMSMDASENSTQKTAINNIILPQLHRNDFPEGGVSNLSSAITITS